ncbi:uncharacterized protein LOC131613274, partial [Vicia villosa]|uniref:uncharacterized protein LOC131613274 n=1 Tax=Vicia villosa TaxID=3911 RepID=UPI00273AF52C
QGDSTNQRNLVGDLQEQFNKIQLEVKAIRGKDLFGKNAQELCLVPSVQIPAKFKVPDFEKYKGSSCPQSHLVMYARKMSTYADNHQLLIHYFQDSLTGAALKWYTGLDSTNIRTFNDLGEAFVRQYKYNSDMAPDRDQLRSMAQKDHEAFKEYAQRWRETAAQINPPLKEKEMTKIFLNTLSPFYYERMIASAPSDFTEMVNMGMRLEEGVRTGRLTKESGSSSGTKKFGSGFPKKKEQSVDMVSQGKPRGNVNRQRQIAAIAPVVNTAPNPGFTPQFQQQQPRPQAQQLNNNQNRVQRAPQFDPIPMTYTELYPALIERGLIQTKAPPPVPERLPWWYKAEVSCPYHQGAPGHDLEHCIALKYEVQRLVRSNLLSFRNLNPNVQANPLPNHGGHVVNMVYGCPGPYRVYNINYSRADLVQMHATLCRGQNFRQHQDVSRVTRSGRVYTPLPPKQPVVPATRQNPVNTPVGNPEETPVSNTNIDVGQSSGTNVNPDFDEILKLIKRSEYKIVDQLMQTPSKISILSLLLNSEAHREALMKVLDQAFVDHDVTVDHFDGIIANITACNNLSFCDEELPEEGRNHNLALHISMNCQSDSLSNVLVDTGSSLNVMPKTTLARLSYQGMPMKFSGVVVKAFDGSRKSVIGEVNLPMTIGPHTFQITFQVMDIQAAYSCLLGRPWIHEAGAVTSTLHQKLKFVTNGKLVTISGEQALMVSHLSNFSFIGADDVEGTQFQGLSLEDESSKKKASISSYKEAVKVVKDGTTTGWGQVVIPTKNETRAGLGCSPTFSNCTKKDETLRPIKETFHSGGFLNPIPQEVNVLIEECIEEGLPDPEEEWKCYLNDSGYISQEEPYPPSEKSKGNETEPVPAEIWDTLGQPSGKFDYMVKYTAPESYKIAIEDIQPTGWGDSFEYNSQPEEAYQPCQCTGEDDRSGAPASESLKPISLVCLRVTSSLALIPSCLAFLSHLNDSK